MDTGTRFLLINEVALGDCVDFMGPDLSLTVAPKGFDSVRGLATTDELPTDFDANEYVIYKVEQQRIRYSNF